MEVVQHKGRSRQSFTKDAAGLNMYHDPPGDEVTLTEFETLAMARLQVLKQIETLKAKGSENMTEEIEMLLKKHEIYTKRNDHISHFILRLAYCRNEELRRWFLNQEVALFRHRFASSKDSDIDDFLSENGMKYPNVDVGPGTALQKKLVMLHGKLNVVNEVYSSCYKVPFQEALELVSQRRVLLENGFAYIARKQLVSIVAMKLRAHLSAELTSTYRATQGLRKQDQRIGRLLSSLQYQQVGSQYKVSRVTAGTVSKEQIPSLAERSFPLCMQHSHASLRSENHLKHGARMQLGLFLKGIGLDLNDALSYWRTCMSRRTPPEKFNKEYAYNIRHNYGKEGKRTSYTPYACAKIIQSAPGAGDHHGCPFRHFDQSHLQAKLRERRIKASDIDDITDLVSNMHYQVACTKYFEVTHEGYKGQSIGNHPNAYFDDSVGYWNNKEGGDASKAVPAQATPAQPAQGPPTTADAAIA